MADYNVNFVRKDSLWIPDERKMGTAYALFDSDLSVGDIGDLALQEAERAGKIRNLEIALVDIKSVKSSDNPELYELIQKGTVSPKGEEKEIRGCSSKKFNGLKYAMQVASPDETSTGLADYLGNVMIDVYTAGKGPFYGSVVYRNPQDGYLDFKRD
jgi:hypothetical protein